MRIGHLTLQPHRQLCDGMRRVPIGRKALDLLSVLAKADGAIVTKDELMEAVWPGVIVEENAIQVHIAALRRALGEAAAGLTTVRGVGYQLVMAAAEPPRSPAIQAAGEPLLAVLAFENRSPDPDLSYFADGVSEEILLAVSRLGGLRVISRSTSFQIAGEERRPAAVRAALGATHSLDGSVRRQGDRVRIVAQLVETAGETLVWSDRFEGALEDIFALQDQVAQQVATALRAQFEAPAERRVNPAAFDLYLRGRQLVPSIAPAPNPRSLDVYWEGRRLPATADTRGQIIGLYTDATEIDPDFADAWSALAFAKAVAARWDEGAAPYAELAEQVRIAAARALALDPASTGARLALSVLEPLASYRLREQYLNEALDIGRNDPEVLRQNGEFAYSVGRLRESASLVAQCWRVDPLNPHTVEMRARSLFETGARTEAFETFAIGRRRWPDIWWFLFEPMLLTAFGGDWPTYDSLVAEKAPNAPQLALARHVGNSLRSPTDAVRQQTLKLAEMGIEANGGVDPSVLVFLDGLGSRDPLFALVERSSYPYMFAADGRHRDGEGFASGIIFGSANRSMRTDPRFVRLCGKLGLCDYWVETGRWPDCADEVPYDFRAEARRLCRG